ncbi:hypothetical protein [Actinomyces oricola]|uniref:hypothetical protein n=1 Tax=Actinomyces oricola TaxID=206043 RepID=UPI000FFEEF2E|nr:hypothetical protein [Actinomyces oricola]
MTTGTIRTNSLAGLSLLQVLTMVGTAILLLLGVMLGGRAFITGVDSTNLVTVPANTVSAPLAEQREPSNRSRNL